MKKSQVGLWIYQNNGGQKIQETLITQLEERHIQVIPNLNLKYTQATTKGLYCQNHNLLDLSCYFSYNCGEQTNYQVYFYERLNTHIPTINSFKSFSITEDKYQTTSLLSEHGINSPDFCMCHIEDKEEIRSFFNKHQKIVCKPIDGYGGHNLALIDNLTQLNAFKGYMNHCGVHYFYAESFIENDNTDFRVDIVNGEFIACYGRKARQNDWRTNITAGGSVFCREADEEMVALAKRAARITGADVAGVDIIFDKHKEEYVVLEVNGIPAFATPEQEKMGLTFNLKKVSAITNLIEQKIKAHEKISETS